MTMVANAVGDPIWINSEGKKFKLSEMPSGYIRNCVPYLERKIAQYESLSFSAASMIGAFDSESMAAYYTDGPCIDEVSEYSKKIAAMQWWIQIFNAELARRLLLRADF